LPYIENIADTSLAAVFSSLFAAIPLNWGTAKPATIATRAMAIISSSSEKTLCGASPLHTIPSILSMSTEEASRATTVINSRTDANPNCDLISTGHEWQLHLNLLQAE